MQIRSTWLKGCLTLLAAGMLPSGTPALAADWEWTLTPYIWGSGVSMDVDARDEQVIGADVSFSDLLDKTDMAAMVHFEGRKGAWGFLFDSVYLDAGEERTSSVDPPLPGGTEVTSDLTTLIVEGAATWRPLEGRAFDVVFGLRALDMDSTVDLDLPTPPGGSTSLETSKSWVDGLVGARYSAAFGKRWDFAIRGDVSAGGTDLTWIAAGTFGVRLGQTDRYNIRFGYRHMEIEVENDDHHVEIETDVRFSGVIAGFGFHW